MTEPNIVTTEVTVAGLVPGSPPLLAWHKRLRGSGGRQKIHTQRTPVLDGRLVERLRREVQPGDQIEITIATDWSQPGTPTHLRSFSARVAGTTRMRSV